MNEKIIIENRNQISICGATKVLTSTATQAIVEVGDCNIVISGNNLEVKKLNLESKEVEFSGEISGIKYTKKAEKISFIKRVFK